MNFFALSQAPPELAMKTASTKPALRLPINRPITPATPKMKPTAIGARIASTDGNSISRWAPLVEIATQRA